MEEPKLEACLEIVRKAKSDNEKFAALLMVAKLTKSKPLSHADRQELLSTIGMKFLIRLLKSKSAPEGCPVSMYQSITLSILSGLCSHPQQIAKLGLKKNIEILNGILLTNSRSDETVTSMVDDCYDILHNLAQTEDGCDQLLQYWTPVSLCTVILDHIRGADRAEGVLRSLLTLAGPKVWLTHDQGLLLHKLMAHLVQCFCQYQDANKFELCGFLQQILQSIPDSMVEECTKSAWLPDLVKTITQILTSRLGEDQRNPTLCLVAALTDRLGMTSVLPPLTADNQLLLVITHLSCIEIRMILENLAYQQIVEKAYVLCSCYLVMENIINYMTTSPSLMLDDKQILQLHSAMMGAANAIISFLMEISERQPPQQYPEPVVVATVRVLGVWLSEETSALKESTYRLLPFLLKICKSQVTWRGKRKARVPGIQSCLKTGPSKGQRHGITEPSKGQRHGITGPSKGQCHGITEPSKGQSHGITEPSKGQSHGITEPDSKGQRDEDSKEPVESHDSPRLKVSSGSEVTSVTDPVELASEMEGCAIRSVCDSNDVDRTSHESTEITREKLVEPTTVTGTRELCDRNKNSNNSNDDILAQKSKFVSFNVDPVNDCDSLVEMGAVCGDIDLVRFMLPAFCHFMVEDIPRQILLQNHTLTWLVDYFSQCLEEITQSKGSVVVLCGALLNLVVLERDLVNTHEDLHRLCEQVVVAVPLLLNEDDVILWSNLVTLGMFLLLRQYNTSKVPPHQKTKFFTVAMSFVKGPFTSTDQTGTLQVGDIYAPVWHDVSQLWFLTLQAICECLPLYPVLSHTLLSTALLPHWSKLLLKGGGEPDENQDAILKLVTVAVRISPKVKDVARVTGFSQISRLYKRTELQDQLPDVTQTGQDLV